MKRYLANSLLLATSVIFALILSEVTLRLLFEPVDYLMPYLIPDEILGHKVQPHSGGHDSWGFRNKSVPKEVDIVAIGDSQTYGVSASAGNSWPAILQRLTQKRVYNLALGGYGPVQYDYLLENKAALLNPSSIIVGFYYGNDLKDAYNVAYNNDYWKQLRRSDFKPAKKIQQAVSFSEDAVFLDSLRDYLAHHSILYRSSMLSFGEALRFVEMKYGRTDQDVTIFEEPKLGIHTGFIPQTMLNAQRLDDPAVREGLRISLDRFLQMKRFCDARGIRLHVVLIPTKENVYAEYIGRDDMHSKNQSAIHNLIENEQEVGELTKTFFGEHHIAYFDVLEPLRRAIGKQTIYPDNLDEHPNKNGYEIIARTIQANLNKE